MSKIAKCELFAIFNKNKITLLFCVRFMDFSESLQRQRLELATPNFSKCQRFSVEID